MLNEYKNELTQKWGEDAINIFLFKIGICLYPVLDASGMGVNAPIAICVENESMAKAVLRELSGFGSSEVIPLGLAKKEFENRICEVKYELIPIICDQISEKNIVNLEVVKDAIISKTLKNKEFYGLPIVLFCGAIPPELSNYLSGKYVVGEQRLINKTVSNDEIVWNIMKNLVDNLSVIEFKLKDLVRGDEDISFLRGASEACKVIVEQDKTISDELYSEFIEDIEMAVNSLEEEWEIVGDYSDWLDLLRDFILTQSKFIIRIFDRNAISYSDEVILGRYPMFDEQYYYFTTQFFTDMCNKIPNIGEMELKKAMCDAGILVGEGKNRNYYTVKVPIKLKSGKAKIEKRRLRITREWLDLPAHLTWKEQIEGNRRNWNGE